ncbi:hypothetical protein CLTEP_11570 [Clostridium tepidiprofundi DSM 19306]|uniref:4Fe-4S Mo/W bis-MGD-type domain-containing protein n=1 Tax=Clostridium tepidiprofundi DSM 19306 TaxID=1121338 RepID=A0A151B506_9CLOT|nr:DUF1667 domain-containing protein [Clostridium tepidiprofundi]KYH34842.1 hypothetical protein CLTEP_11570 [Clostridium tepidiprofundi DSM 19306]
MSNKVELTCIGCPIGCQLEVEIEDKKIIKVKGNSCIRGEIYAKKECTNPTRIVTSSVCVENGVIDVVSVKTEKDVPKNKIFKVVDELKDVAVKAPVKIGEIIVENVANTGVNIVATKNVEAR